MSSIQEDYESIAYPHYVHPLADPARLAAVGQLLGLKAASPAGCRVLDIGCGAATHLLALAARSPRSEFVGIDFSGPDIASAQALAAEAGLKNVRFEQADLLTWKGAGAKFDYIIAYGLFSWVPDEVKERLLATVRACLAPQGIACISYMTYPGCKQPEALRDLLRLRTEALTDPTEKIAAAHGTLDFLDRAWKALPGLPHAGYLREEVGRIRVKEPHFLLLDDLGVERDPCYLMQFVQWAAEHELRYLGESEFHTMLLENLPPDSARELAALQLDRLETEQMLDYVTNRAFRCTLLVGPEAEVSGLNAAALRGLALGGVLQPKGKARPGAAEGKFLTARKTAVTLRSVPLVACAHALAARPGALVPFPVAVAAAQEIAGRPFTEEELARLGEDLLSLYGRRQLELSAQAFTPPATVPPRPRLSPLNAVLARHRAMVVTATQQAVRLTAEEQALCALLDGSRTVAELLRDSGAGGGKIEPFLRALKEQGCLGVDGSAV